MNRIKVPFEQIYDFDNCKRAIRNAAKKKKHRKFVINVLKNIDKYAMDLSEKLRTMTYELHTGIPAIINEGTQKKTRELSKPIFYPDQCLHWAVMQVLQPYFRASFYVYSCASVPGRGTHKAKEIVQGFFKDLKGTKYCLQFDIHHFYENVDKGILVQALQRYIKDPRILKVLTDIVYSYKGSGLPIGYYPSPWLANFYLTALDRYIKEKCGVKYMVRYMDNVVIYSSNKRHLSEVFNLVSVFLKTKLRLSIKGDWQKYKMPYKDKRGNIVDNRFTDFCGFKIYRYKTTIRRSIFTRIMRLLRKLKNGKYTLHRAYAFVSYRGYLLCTNSYNLFREYILNKINLKKLKEIIRNESRYQNRKLRKTQPLCA